MVSCMSAMIFFGAYMVSQRIWLTTLPDRDPDGVMVYPVTACNFINAKQLKGNLLTPFVAGGYVSWRSHPAIRVSLDGRYEVAYRDDVLPKHDRVAEFGQFAQRLAQRRAVGSGLGGRFFQDGFLPRKAGGQGG